MYGITHRLPFVVISQKEGENTTGGGQAGRQEKTGKKPSHILTRCSNTVTDILLTLLFSNPAMHMSQCIPILL